MIREWASEETLDKITDALTPPPDWRDPDTGLPAGWSDDEDEDWSMFASAMRG
jgi:hypothetical protein